MTKREIAILSFKVLSIYTFIRVIDQLQYVFYYFQTEPFLQNLLIKTLPPLLLLICGGLLWYLASYLASSVFKSSLSENEPNASLADIQRIAFMVVGLFLIASALPELVNIVITSLTLWVIGGKPVLIKLIIVFFLKVGLGFWLLLGSHGIIKLIHLMQRE